MKKISVQSNILETRSINAFYGELQILWDVSIEVKEGKITVIVGSNGAGKTTLLKTISGLTYRNKGSIFFEGQEISKIKPHKIPNLGIIHLPEGRGVFPNMTVHENMELGAYIKRARPKIKQNLEWCFELFPILKTRRKQLAGTMSGGEQQMVGIARSLIADPKIFILDELSLGLMPRLVQELFDVIQKINKEGVTIVLVEQNVQQAVEICDNYYVLESGRIIHSGKKGDFLDDELLRQSYLGI